MDREIVGWALVGAGFLDLVVAFAVVGPRLAEAQRRVVVTAIAAGGGLMAALGGCLIAGVL